MAGGVTGEWCCSLCPATGSVTGWTREQRQDALVREFYRHYAAKHKERP